ncbi:unnamed protein product [Adineta steineri]|uniref:Uncharacterized protein n=1 Tax=Adineta steineri TaxID=433720 RepID=A0A818QGX3_9BILA|nr:unnamed protein product [Adineta steineri]CAF3639922.1 unnamed protein product [Adineta steineri]
MSSQTTHTAQPAETRGIRIFVRSAYPTKYNFAVENYNAVSVVHKATMRGGRLLLFRSIVAVVWIIAMVFAILALISAGFVTMTILLSALYLALTIYNAYVFFNNRDLLRATRLLRAKTAGPDGRDFEWVNVPIDSRSANERLAAVEQSALDSVRKEFVGSNKLEIECMVYTKRYADTYPIFPKELLLHFIAFSVAVIIGIIMAAL